MQRGDNEKMKIVKKAGGGRGIFWKFNINEPSSHVPRSPDEKKSKKRNKITKTSNSNSDYTHSPSNQASATIFAIPSLTTRMMSATFHPSAPFVPSPLQSTYLKELLVILLANGQINFTRARNQTASIQPYAQSSRPKFTCQFARPDNSNLSHCSHARKAK